MTLAPSSEASEILDPVGGDWQLRGLGLEHEFIRMTADAIDGANRAQRANPNFPGWKLYSRIMLGDSCFDRDLAAFSIRIARAYTRARKLNGRAVIGRRARKNLWIKQCGIDALEYVIAGKYSASADARATQFATDDEGYSRVRDCLAAFLLDGFQQFASEALYQLRRVKNENRRIGETALDGCFVSIMHEHREKIMRQLPES